MNDISVGLAHGRSQRANRGSRMAALMKNDLSELEDDEFWGKDGLGSLIFKDDEADQEFEDKEQLEDQSDSDIDLSEDEDDNNTDHEAEITERKKRKVKSVYQDPALKKRKVDQSKKQKKGAAFKPKIKESLPVESPKENDESRHELRTSTLKHSALIKAKIAKEELEQKKKKKVKKKTPKKVTQQERLRQIKYTERENSESLLELMKYEEEIKKVVKPKYTISGPVITYYSNPEVNSVIFTEIPRELECIKETYPISLKCAVTGKPARYLDPLTNLPYYDIEAFKILREMNKNEFSL